MSLWAQALLHPKNQSWYKELGSGMGQTLNTASAMKAFTLADRGTWASFTNKSALKICVEEDKALLNPYGAILVHEKGRKWQEWLISVEGKAAINAFKVNGQQLFFAP
jgi:tungstate transport system substrate-binding protein